MARDIEREHVLKAIDEYDKIGSSKFLKKYGFGKSRKYIVLYKGKQYTSKAILGAAYGYKTKGVPQTSKDIYGGQNDAVKTLRALRFQIVELGSGSRDPFGEEYGADEGAKVAHRRSEKAKRNAAIVRKKKQSIFAEFGKLACEICDFDFHATYGELGEGFAEVHHLKPLAKNNLATFTKLGDLAIVCANCHRMLHRLNLMSVAELKAQIASARSA